MIDLLRETGSEKLINEETIETVRQVIEDDTYRKNYIFRTVPIDLRRILKKIYTISLPITLQILSIDLPHRQEMCQRILHHFNDNDGAVKKVMFFDNLALATSTPRT